MKTTTIVAVILGVLLLISVLQAFQLNSLRTKVIDNGLSVGSSAGSVPVASAPAQSGRTTSPVPSNIQNLPQMVGGC